MHIQDVFDNHPVTSSFEFFPPKTPEAADALFRTVSELEALSPSFVDVTYGAGGSTRQLTHDLVVRIKRETKLTTVPHLTCVCHGEDEIKQVLERYAEVGISNILALGGDPPRDKPDWDRSKDAFRYATDLVRYIRDFRGHPDKRGFGIGAACFPEGHPATPNRLVEMDHLKAKVDAGTDYLVTQMFFDNRDFYDFRERCELAGIKVPILAGLMPVTSAKGLKRMAELSAGSRFPAGLLRALRRATSGGDDIDAVQRVGVHWATEQCRDLLDNKVRGLHFYTLNRSDATRRIYESLGLRGKAMA